MEKKKKGHPSRLWAWRLGAMLRASPHLTGRNQSLRESGKAGVIALHLTALLRVCLTSKSIKS